VRTADLDGSFEFEEDRLVDEDLAGLCAEELDLVLLQLDLLAGAVASDCRLERENGSVSGTKGEGELV
jgi:hypothetical protein